MSADFRCAAAALTRGDTLVGTASPTRLTFMMEDNGPWGEKAWRDSRLPDGVGQRVLTRSAQLGIRPMLIRQQHRRRSAVSTRRVFVSTSVASGCQVYTTTLEDPRELLDWDFAAFAEGDFSALRPWRKPLLLVCTHSKHDVCCAERGRPVLAELVTRDPDNVWGCSHLGGDRFAANLLIADAGLYYGRLDPTSAREVYEQHLAGKLVLDHVRGRTCWPMSVQAAEIYLRRHLADAVDGGYSVMHRRQTADDVETTTWRIRGNAEYAVSLRHRVSVPCQLTCNAARQQVASTWDVVSIQAIH